MRQSAICNSVVMPLAACTTNAYVGKRQASNKPLVDPNGHTDNTGSVAYSIELSDRRAHGVAYYPISRELDRRRLYTRDMAPITP